MYQSIHPIANQTKQQLKARIEKYIQLHPIRRCRALKRRVHLSKYIEANHLRSDATVRYRAFFAAMQILQKQNSVEEKMINGRRCFSMQGKALGGEMVTLHLREEMLGKNRILFLVSTFYKE